MYLIKDVLELEMLAKFHDFLDIRQSATHERYIRYVLCLWFI